MPLPSVEQYAGVTQMVEWLICNQQAAGSIPVTGSTRESGDHNPFLRSVGIPAAGRAICGCSSIGRAPVFQAGGCGFEPRYPLQPSLDPSIPNFILLFMCILHNRGAVTSFPAALPHAAMTNRRERFLLSFLSIVLLLSRFGSKSQQLIFFCCSVGVSSTGRATKPIGNLSMSVTAS